MQIRNIVQAMNGLVMIAFSLDAESFPITFSSRLQSYLYDASEKMTIVNDKLDIVETTDFNNYLPSLRKVAEKVRTIVKPRTDFRIGGRMFVSTCLLTKEEIQQLTTLIGSNL